MTYPGGKGGCYHQIINLIPPHEIYIEAFLGGGMVMTMKLPAKQNIAVEIDQSVLSDYLKPFDQLIQKYNVCGIDFLQDFMDGEYKGSEFVYCDPPYLLSTCKSKKSMYGYVFTESQHVELLDVLKTIPCMAMISGYDSDLYNDNLVGWNKTQFQVGTRQGSAIETLWFNYDWPIELHDYRYLGTNYRERERIMKKTKRWINNLKRMPELEKRAILQALNENVLPAS